MNGLLKCFFLGVVLLFAGGGWPLSAESPDNGFSVQRLAAVSMENGVSKVLFHGDYAYALSGSDIQVVDISNPASPNVTGTVTGSDSGGFIFFRVAGDYLYALDTDQTGLYIFDISNPGVPVQSGFCPVDVLLGVVDIEIIDGYVYVVKDFGSNINIIDVSDAANPVILKTLTDAYSFVGDFNVYGRTGYYVMNGWPSIGFIDVSDPVNPVSSGNVYYGDRPTADIFVSGDYLYMGYSSALAGYYSNSFNVYDLAQWPDVTYQGGVHVSDDEHSCRGLFKAGSYVFGAYGEPGVRIFDVSDPADISIAGIIVTGGRADCVRVYHDMIFIGTGAGLEIWQYPALTASTSPFGTFETPQAGAEVSGGIPVSGWVLDDQGIGKVEIFRDPVAGESGGLKKIGDAVLVADARPDVENDYPQYPFNYKAGWGYMMLTNRLPNGNGTFTIHALATDVDGHQVSLGNKTITVNNADAVKPFGAIDKPLQGGTASGSNYVNFGWALTSLPNAIPEDGNTITVWVDGQPLGHPVYNRYRADIAALFPGYLNSDGAVGYFYLDTTAYANGVHTIAWSVEDNAGNRDGIGSRYFSIRNTEDADAGENRMQKMQKRGSANMGFLSQLGRFEDSSATVTVKKGFSASAPMIAYTPDKNGRIILDLRVGERVEISLGNSGNYWGFMRGKKQALSLPVGSRLDTEKGIFYWQPGPGFRGEFPLVFYMGDRNGGEGKQLKMVKVKMVKVLCKIR